ncbi:MAG: hypothetical protein JHC87_01775 [Thermoleophilaceae bacterium]|nr:hypothetical protein [Thermoleophilaceae bacterium]
MAATPKRTRAGRPSTNTDQAMRNRQVVFRMGALHEELTKREHRTFSLPQIARRDLTRIYGLYRNELRRLEIDVEELRRVAVFLEQEHDLFGTGSVEVLAAVVNSAAEACSAPSIGKLNLPQALTVIDLIQRGGTPDGAVDLYGAERQKIGM